MCFLIENYLNKKNNDINFIDINYKLQEIVDEEDQNLGFEVLITPENLPKKTVKEVYHREIRYPHLTRSLIARLDKYITHRSDDFKGKHLFINLERSNLCDKYLLCDIVILKNSLADLNINIVVEITERNPCNDCSKIRKGFEFLQKQKVLLAVDDYNLDYDFRDEELFGGFYHFIKVEHSCEPNYYSKIIELSKRTRSKVIIERVETHNERQQIRQSDIQFWGLQGFLYTTIEVSL